MQSRRIMLMAVMVLSALGFVIDRIFLNAPASASAEQLPSPVDPSAPASAGPRPGVTQIETATTDDPSLIWLNQLEKPQDTPRDIFTPTAELLTFLEAQKPDPGRGSVAVNDAEDKNDPARFEAEHTLQATFLSDQKMMAMINSKVVQVGSILDGYTIVHIASHRVECLRDGERAILRMEVPLP